MLKSVLEVVSSPQGHWVGDGFPVRSLFSYDKHGARVSPFLLLDYAGPFEFSPTGARRGVGEHPHRGFETVTIVYQGEVAHRDSSGGGGEIGPGDVQWMTAAGGIIHDEFHSTAFAKRGGALEMVQLWVNLPAQHKMSAARYQTLAKAHIPEVAAGDARLRIIAGHFADISGPAATFSDLNVWDARLAAGHSAELPIPAGHNTVIAALRGSLLLNDSQPLRAAELAILDAAGNCVKVQASQDAAFLVLSGEPIDEPIVGYGPFVMNSRAEIETAIADFNSGNFGHIP